MIHPNQTISELIAVLQTRIEKRQFKDSVHKIKLMTTLQNLRRMLKGK